MLNIYVVKQMCQVLGTDDSDFKYQSIQVSSDELSWTTLQTEAKYLIQVIKGVYISHGFNLL